jgi:hypothetical protein
MILLFYCIFLFFYTFYMLYQKIREKSFLQLISSNTGTDRALFLRVRKGAEGALINIYTNEGALTNIHTYNEGEGG